MQYLKNLPAQTKALLTVAAFVIASLIYGYYHEEPKLPQKQFVPVPPVAAVKNVPKEEIKPEKVVVYQKKALSKKMELPLEVLADPAKQVTATADIPASKGGTEVVAVLDTNTGITNMVAKAKPLPFWSFENEKRLGVGYGLTSRGENEIKLYGEYTFVRVGNVYGALQGEVNNKAEAKGFVTADYRW